MDTNTTNTKSLTERLQDLINDPGFIYDQAVNDTLAMLNDDRARRAELHDNAVNEGRALPLRRVRQFECYPLDHDPIPQQPFIMTGWAQELRGSRDLVRVEIDSHVKLADAIHRLKNLVTWLEEDGAVMEQESGDYLPKEVYTESGGWVVALPPPPRSEEDIPF